MLRLLTFAVLIVVVAGCGSTTPCDDSDPVGPCATSPSQVRGGN